MLKSNELKKHISRYRIFSNRRRASNKRCPLINAAPLNSALIRIVIRDDTHVTSTIKGEGEGWCYRIYGAGDVTSVLDIHLHFFSKEIWNCIVTGHHAQSNINILLTRNLSISSGVRHGSHPLTIPLHHIV